MKLPICFRGLSSYEFFGFGNGGEFTLAVVGVVLSRFEELPRMSRRWRPKNLATRRIAGKVEVYSPEQNRPLAP